MEKTMSLDIWQYAASTAGMMFNISFVTQIRMTMKTRNVEGLSFSQWAIFALGSGVFVGFYAHLNQWIMANVSLFGMLCCLSMLFMIQKFKVN